ncbi:MULTISPECIES: hypothetical protein [Xanthocytophaga]|uniref:Uncharacterized protein n=2 Tax=Xanthocytophaga TaxID=3078918 RepID=A0AAE3QU03_9BACT|nr:MULTISPECIES: hypothetical protein [Xanthocytophaga]MDJ1469817.1 hypothetical protein [Xanthocytophaga flavus]MDJ1483221.1 hypothetical protein [Xanthocytophaga flavus]MDJ1503258.1 hypothetical protein [Xanthocytophaga agilis]
MSYVLELLKILLPAGLVLYAMFLTMQSFLTKQFEQKLIEVKSKNIDLVLPIRLQAYERMCLFLERIAPNNLIRRVNNAEYNATELHSLLLSEVREEFNHNLSQQVYMSDEAWTQIKSAMEEIIVLINDSASNIPPDARGIELAKRIFEQLIEQNVDPTSRALKFIKDEIRVVF